MLKKFLKNKLQKGQALIFFAIAIPTLFMFVAAVVEFGWWFINQSRLQNAADAAVLAGAEKMVSESSSTSTSSSNSTFKIDFVNKVPETFTTSETPKDTVKTVAQGYADKNFSTNQELAAYYNSFQHKTYGDTAKFNPVYYAVELQGKAKHLFGILDKFGDMNLRAVAVAKITENVDGVLEGLKVRNVITGNWEVQNRYKTLNEIKDYDSNGNPRYKNTALREEFKKATGYETMFTGRWNHYKEPNKKIYYTSGNEFRTEVVDVYVTRDLSGNTTWTDDANGNTYALEYGSAFSTSANQNDSLIGEGDRKLKTNGQTGNVYSWRNVESINLDWAQDFNFTYTNNYSVQDWDIGYALPDDISKIEAAGNNESGKSWKLDQQLNHRIHGLITFYEMFPAIAKKLNKNGEVDEENGKFYYEPLWARIESEPMWSYLGSNKFQKGLDTVHQIIININESNWMEEETETDSKGNKVVHPIPIEGNDERLKHFNIEPDEKVIFRPIVFFYDGPETNATNIFLDKSNISHPQTRAESRNSKPVILNLNADFAGILYMPNSPVVLVTNGHKFRGFIRAKSYKVLATSDDVEGTFKTVSHTTKNRDNNKTLESPTLYMKTIVYTPSGSNAYEREVHGEVQFKDATPTEVKSKLPAGCEYSIFNIGVLEDTFFGGSYSTDDKIADMLMTTD